MSIGELPTRLRLMPLDHRPATAPAKSSPCGSRSLLLPLTARNPSIDDRSMAGSTFAGTISDLDSRRGYAVAVLRRRDKLAETRARCAEHARSPYARGRRAKRAASPTSCLAAAGAAANNQQTKGGDAQPKRAAQ